ncbi:MAG: hypothetical protein ACRDP8_20275 [Actinopolymorphaceae bacterium]
MHSFSQLDPALVYRLTADTESLPPVWWANELDDHGQWWPGLAVELVDPLDEILDLVRAGNLAAAVARLEQLAGGVA